MCGMAPNMAMLIAFRALQGFVAGPMIPLSQTLLLSSYPRAQAGMAMAMWAMTTLIAPVVGPVVDKATGCGSPPRGAGRASRRASRRVVTFQTHTGPS